jgi:hypothetical protein
MSKQAKRQLAGSGEALPAGAIGEIITSASSATGAFANGVVTQNVGTLTLTPGIWLVSVGIKFIVNSSFNFNVISISTVSSALDEASAVQPQAATAGAYDSYGSLVKVIRVTSSTPIYAVTKTWIPTGTSTYGNMTLQAVRLT